jgi:hypothetical protein
VSERGDYRSTYCTFWDDPDVHGLSHLAYRVLTTLKGTLPASGIGIVYTSQLAERCGSVTHDEIAAALSELERAKPGESHGWIVRERNVIWIVNGLRYEPTLTSANGNHRKFLRERLLAPLGEKPQIVAAFRRYYAEWFTGAVPDLPETHAHGMPIPSERVSDHNPVQSSPIQSVDAADEARGVVPGEPELTALYLTIWANAAITERWGEQPNPFIQANSVNLAEALVAAGVEPQCARLSIYRQCRESQQGRHPRSVNYFRRGIEEDWQQELARRALAASGEKAPAVATKPTGEGREHWADRNDRKEREEQEAGEFRRVEGLVSARRARSDGDTWWRRMQREAGTGNVRDIYRYAVGHLEDTRRATA